MEDMTCIGLLNRCDLDCGSIKGSFWNWE